MEVDLSAWDWEGAESWGNAMGWDGVGWMRGLNAAGGGGSMRGGWLVYYLRCGRSIMGQCVTTLFGFLGGMEKEREEVWNEDGTSSACGGENIKILVRISCIQTGECLECAAMSSDHLMSSLAVSGLRTIFFTATIDIPPTIKHYDHSARDGLWRHGLSGLKC